MAEADEDARKAFEQGSVVAQVFSGIFFSGLAVWLTVTNGGKLAFVQRASLEKRLTVCCFLNTYVGLFSAFFNFFQLTSVDDIFLPSRGTYSLDLARPIEWIMTCPLMQLVLVLMGGAKIPEYRRYLMPAFSVMILVCGTTGSVQEPVWARALCWCAGCVVYCIMFRFNREQIIEYSGGEEGILMGDSEFRKATLLLLGTWSLFPIWYALSPEGLGILKNLLIVQVGWAFLNIVAKFVFIFYIQRIKDLYCNRMKTKRELQGNKAAAATQHRQTNGALSPALAPWDNIVAMEYDVAMAYEQAELERKKGQLSAVVIETMSFLGMAQHTERFMKLLENASISTVGQVESLTRAECDDLQLPSELVTALQRRLRVWKLEMVDDAEVGLDRGEEHYLKKALDVPNIVPDPFIPQVSTGMSEADIQELLVRADANFQQNSRSALEAEVGRICQVLLGHLSGVEGRLAEAVGLTSKTMDHRSEMRAMESRVHIRMDDVLKTADDIHAQGIRLGSVMDQQFLLMSTKLDAICQRLEHFSQKIDFFEDKVVKSADKTEASSKAVHAGFEAQGHQLATVSEALRDVVLQRLEESTAQCRAGLEESTQQLVQRIEAATAKAAAEAESSLRRRFEELEGNTLSREEEKDSLEKRRHEEILKLSSQRRLDELFAQVQRLADHGEGVVESAKTSLEADLQSCTARMISRVESFQVAVVRQYSDSEFAMQQRIEQALEQVSARAAQGGAAQAAQRAEKAVEGLDVVIQKAVTQAAEQGSSESARAMEKAAAALEASVAAHVDNAMSRAALNSESLVATLESGIQKRLDDAVSRAAAHSAQQAGHRAMQAIESLESAQRAGFADAVANITDRVQDVQAAQMRKISEREDRSTRRMEELLDDAAGRHERKLEDARSEIVKELHGFAKRLNSKIPLM